MMLLLDLTHLDDEAAGFESEEGPVVELTKAQWVGMCRPVTLRLEANE